MAFQEIRLVNGEAVAFVEGDNRAVYGVQETDFGFCLLAKSAQGIVAIDFRDEAEELEPCMKHLQLRWPELAFRRDDALLSETIRTVTRGQKHALENLPLHLKGTPFQLRVWQALLQVGDGETSDYSRIAAAIGMPKAMRAVGNANGRNPVAFLVPCHRILAKNGGLGGYATGLHRKEKMLAFERELVIKIA